MLLIDIQIPAEGVVLVAPPPAGHHLVPERHAEVVSQPDGQLGPGAHGASVGVEQADLLQPVVTEPPDDQGDQVPVLD